MGGGEGVLTGSSPLTRGKRRGVRAQEGVEGLIPAHAGKTIGATVTAGGSEAHPRSRGENGIYGMYGIAAKGSSPLTRGKPQAFERAVIGARLIPAHAGKTRPPWPGGHGQTAHPRSRGENLSICDWP